MGLVGGLPMSDENNNGSISSGEKGEVYQAEAVKTEDKASGLAWTALILAILSFCCCGLVAGVPAAIIGWIENKNINSGKSSEKGKWMAIVGIILGLWSILWTLLWLSFYLFYFGGIMFLKTIIPF